MSHLATTLLSNALLVLPLGLLVFLVTRWLRHPGLVWALWGLVLLKFVTPALIPLPVDVASLGSIPDGQTTGTADLPTTPESWGAPDRPQPIRDAGAHHFSGAERPATPAAVPSDTPDILPGDADLPLDEAPPLPASDEPAVLVAEQDPTSGSDTAETSPAVIAPSVISTTTLGTTPAPAPPQTEDPTSRTSDRVSLSAPPVSRTPHPAWRVALAIDWPRILWTAWVIGALFMLLLALWRVIRLHRLLASAAPADDELVAIASELSGQLGLRRLPALRLTDGRIPPLLYGGVRRAVILLPRPLLNSLDAESRRTLLAHELAHIARRDHWTRWIELLVRCLYWWHPLAWYAGRRLRDAEEHCCDARVVALLPGSAGAYARTILTTVDYLAGHTHPVPTLATGLQPLRRSVRPLHRRLTMIVDDKPKLRLSWPSRLIIIALALCVLPLSLMAQPQHEQTTTGPAPLTFHIPVLGSDLNSANKRLFSFFVGFDDPSRGKREQSSSGSNADDSSQGSFTASTDANEPATDATLAAESEDSEQRPAGQELADLVEEYNRLMEQRLYAEAMVIADKARELDPDNPGLVILEAESKFAYRNDRNKETRQLDDEEPATITVQRKSYAIDGVVGQAVVRLLEQMQRSQLADPLMAHLSGGDKGAHWDNTQGKWLYTAGVTVITTPQAHKAIGAFIDGLRELRPPPGQSGPEELQIRKVVYDWQSDWDSNRSLAVLLQEAVKMGHIGYIQIPDNQDARGIITTTHRLAITTADPVHKVIGPFIDFLNQQQAERDAAADGTPADSLAGPVPDPSVSGSSRAVRDGPIAGEPQKDESRGDPGAFTLSSGTAVPRKRPQVVTAPQETEEITIEFSEYEVHPLVVDQLYQFLRSVEGGLPLVSVMQDQTFVMQDQTFRAEDPPPARLRILALAETHAVLGDFLKLFQPAKSKAKDAADEDREQAIVLVRGEYELDSDAAMKLAKLLQTCERFALALQIGEQYGLATPLIVTHKQSRVTVIAERELQSAIREFIAYLSENWKTAAKDSASLGGVGDLASEELEVAPDEASSHEDTPLADVPREEQMHRVIESIDRVLGDDGQGREKAVRAIESRGTESLSDRLQEIKRETAVSLFPLVEEVERFRDRLGLDHSLVKARQKKLVLERSKQLEDLAVLDEHPQIQVRAWDRLGILVGALSPSQLKLIKEKGYPGGMRVAIVRPKGPAAKVGVQKGFALAAINGVAVASHGDLETALKLVDPDQSQIELVCMNGNNVLKARIQIPPAASTQVEGLDVKIAELELEWANETLKATKRFVEKGFKTESDLKAAALEVLKAQRELERLKTQPASRTEEDPVADFGRNALTTRTREFAQQRTLTAEQHTPWQIMQVVAAAGRDAQILLVDGELTPALEYVSNNPQFNGKSWFVAGRDGLHVRPSSSPYVFEGHPNQFAAWLVAGGAELDFPLFVDDKEFTLQNLVKHAQQTIDPSKDQSWTLALLAQTVDVDAEWTSESGETWSLARLVELELDAGLERAADQGRWPTAFLARNGWVEEHNNVYHRFHRLMAITLARNAWVKEHGEPTGVWEKADKLINDMIQQVQRNQSEDGLLTLGPTRAAPYGHELKETGQVLTWLAAALPDEDVRGAWIARAVFRLEGMLRASVDSPMEVSEYFAAVRGMRAIAEAIE